MSLSMSKGLLPKKKERNGGNNNKKTTNTVDRILFVVFI